MKRRRISEINYQGKLAVSGADIREGGFLANPEDGIVARSAVGSSFPVHSCKPKTDSRKQKPIDQRDCISDHRKRVVRRERGMLCAFGIFSIFLYFW